jgi:DNA-binding NarL/FixJ family response regulator
MPGVNSNTPPPNPDQEQRWKQLQEAQGEYLRISEQLDAIVRSQSEIGTPGIYGAEHPDGLQEIVNLANRRKIAFEDYQLALTTYRDCIRKQPVPPPPSGGEELTTREREVLALIADGKTSREIGHQLGITFKTATCHRSNIMMKLRAHTTADVVRTAVRMGLVNP